MGDVGELGLGVAVQKTYNFEDQDSVSCDGVEFLCIKVLVIPITSNSYM